MLGVTLTRLRFEMVGSRSLADLAVKNAILEVLLKHPKFVPEQWGYEERGGDKFDREEVLRAVPVKNMVLQFRRRRGVRQNLLLGLSDRPILAWAFEPPPANATWPEIFGVSEDLSAAYQPDFALVKTRVEMKLDVSDENSRNQYLMDSPCDCSPAWYRKAGISGLGIRTVFGPRLIGQIGRDRLQGLPPPAVVRDLKWGGVLVDLAPEPWSRQMAELRSSWVACTKHLMPSGFFTKATLDANGRVKEEVPSHPGWDPGGLVK